MLRRHQHDRKAEADRGKQPENQAHVVVER
jgi:hypothetical protein